MIELDLSGSHIDCHFSAAMNKKIQSNAERGLKQADTLFISQTWVGTGFEIPLEITLNDQKYRLIRSTTYLLPRCGSIAARPIKGSSVKNASIPASRKTSSSAARLPRSVREFTFPLRKLTGKNGFSGRKV